MTNLIGIWEEWILTYVKNVKTNFIQKIKFYKVITTYTSTLMVIKQLNWTYYNKHMLTHNNNCVRINYDLYYNWNEKNLKVFE